MKYIYEEGDYNCDKCGVLGDFLGGGVGKDGIERVIICGIGKSNTELCVCDNCLENIDICNRCADIIEKDQEIWFPKGETSCGICKTSEEIDNYMKRDYQGSKEIQASQLLSYLVKRDIQHMSLLSKYHYKLTNDNFYSLFLVFHLNLEQLAHSPKSPKST